MRLTCPNCGAEYQVPEGLIPPGGKHVQCSACHTRWFMRGAARPALSEDQILQRLETWSPRPRPVAVPSGLAPVPAPEPRPRAPEPATEPEDFVWESPAAAAPAASETEPRPLPAPVAPEQPRAPVPLRIAPRLELGAGPAVPAPPPPARNRFARGFLCAVIVAALAIGAYLLRDAISALVPAAAPALDAYGATIDAGREWFDHQLAVLRGEAAP